MANLNPEISDEEWGSDDDRPLQDPWESDDDIPLVQPRNEDDIAEVNIVCLLTVRQAQDQTVNKHILICINTKNIVFNEKKDINKKWK